MSSTHGFVILECALLLCLGSTLQARSAPSDTAPDYLPTVELRLTPPLDPLPDITAEVARLESARKQVEANEMSELHRTFANVLATAKVSINSLVAHSMKVEHRRSGDGGLEHTGGLAVADSKSAPRNSEDAFVIKVNVEPGSPPGQLADEKIKDIEEKNNNADADMFRLACAELQGLSDIMLSELATQLSEPSAILNRSPWEHRIALLEKAHRQLQGFAPTTNVRIVPTETAFPRVADIVQAMESRRAEKEDEDRNAILALELKLVKAVANLMQEALAAAL